MRASTLSKLHIQDRNQSRRRDGRNIQKKFGCESVQSKAYSAFPLPGPSPGQPGPPDIMDDEAELNKKQGGRLTGVAIKMFESAATTFASLLVLG